MLTVESYFCALHLHGVLTDCLKIKCYKLIYEIDYYNTDLLALCFKLS